jgi:acyl-CoA dehydrogenase family member 9
VFASEAIQRSCYESLQIAAGNGFMREFPYEQATRDSRILSIFEGTNEILRLYIALSGMKDVGSSLSEIKSAVSSIFNDPIKGFGVLSNYAGRRFKSATGIGADRIGRNLEPRLRKAAETYEKYAGELSNATDQLLRMHGKKIADEQYQLKRVGDVTIDLFVGLCVLSRADSMVTQKHRHAEQAINMAELFAHQARRRMASNVRAMAVNEDAARDQLAQFILDQDGYVWDVI